MKLEVIRHIDKVGRICLPKDFRKSFDITEDTQIIIEEVPEGILLRVKSLSISVKKNQT